MSPEMKVTVREEAEERSMTMSEYGRITLIAGRKQIVALEEEMEGKGGLALEQEVLDAVPTDADGALSHEEISEQVLAKVEQQIFELLDSDDRIKHSAAHGGYYLE
ncbi:hypothetical protein C475_18776 [Halosimplex carlsbadense 2-9-1]|uniref:Uncharacterized protein n=2 Tax=Halosimplex carlsbadense TaxID=171164 RepID=M0CE07_9EURY|nr:hypothetical protein C475_18776 [Halosimplex carlsbadense 2-9-1]